MSNHLANAGVPELLEFNKKFPEASRKLESLQSNVIGQCKIRATSRIPQVSPFAHDVTFAMSGRSIKSAVRRLDPKDNRVFVREDVYCLTPESSFRLGRTDLDSKFNVQSLGDPSDHLDEKFDTVFGRFYAASFASYGTPLYRQMASDNFKVVDVHPVKVGDKVFMQVIYELGSDGFVNKGSVTCDPERYWAFLSGELEVVNNQFKVKYTFSVKYREDQGIPFPEEVTYVDPDGRRIVAQFSDIKFVETPKNEFTMPYYGLPDLASRQRRDDRIYLGVVGLVGLVILGSVLATYRLLIYRSRRAQAA